MVFLEWVLTADTPLSCSLGEPGSQSESVYGESRWSWAELGEVCRFELPMIPAFEQGPGLTRWGFVVALLGWGSALGLTARLVSRGRANGAVDEPPSEANTASR